MHRLPGILFLLLCMPGCGSSLSTEEVEKVKAAVTQGLATWQAKKPVTSLVDGWKFLDEDWKAGSALSEYSITNVTIDKDKMHRCWVTLKFIRQGKQVMREICYIVDLNRKLINRDPYS